MKLNLTLAFTTIFILSSNFTFCGDDCSNILDTEILRIDVLSNGTYAVNGKTVSEKVYQQAADKLLEQIEARIEEAARQNALSRRRTTH